jgi:hypothetical protein
MVRVPRIAAIALVACAALITFGIGLTTAAAAVTECQTACELDCGPGNCEQYEEVGCGCIWYCSDGSQGSIVCG